MGMSELNPFLHGFRRSPASLSAAPSCNDRRVRGVLADRGAGLRHVGGPRPSPARGLRCHYPRHAACSPRPPARQSVLCVRDRWHWVCGRPRGSSRVGIIDSRAGLSGPPHEHGVLVQGEIFPRSKFSRFRGNFSRPAPPFRRYTAVLRCYPSELRLSRATL